MVGIKLKNLSIIAISCLTMLTLAGCQPAMNLSPWENYPVPSCPKTRLLKDTDIITAYRSGLGRDITDIRYEAEINGFKGNCEYIGKKGLYTAVRLNIKVEFKVTRGPAIKDKFIDFSYFVAIPEFYPKSAGRRNFTLKVKFPENRNSINVVDEELEISIPLNNLRKGPDSEVYIGFLLTPEQLEYNRKTRKKLRL